MPRYARQAALVLLVLVNVALLITLLAATFGLPAAFAQSVGGGERFLVVSGATPSGSDVVYLIDSNQRRLYVFGPGRVQSGPALELRDGRDLSQDFQRQPAPIVPRRER